MIEVKTGELDALYALSIQNMRDAANEIEQLRRIIEEAPHAPGCAYRVDAIVGYGDEQCRDCNCFKSRIAGAGGQP